MLPDAVQIVPGHEKFVLARAFEKALSFRISLLHHQIEWLPRDDTAVESPGGERKPRLILESAKPHSIDWATSEAASHLTPRGSGD